MSRGTSGGAPYTDQSPLSKKPGGMFNAICFALSHLLCANQYPLRLKMPKRRQMASDAAPIPPGFSDKRSIQRDMECGACATGIRAEALGRRASENIGCRIPLSLYI